MYKFPKFLKVLLFVKIFESMGYYGIRLLLILFLITQLGYADQRAYQIAAVSGAIGFMSPMLGAILADRFFGFKRTLALGGVLILLGQAVILYSRIDKSCFLFGLSILMLGTGVFKSNTINLLGDCYSKDDPNRTHGFILFHIAINIGSASASIICGYIAAVYGWYYAFTIAFLSSFTAVSIYLRHLYVFAAHGNSPNPQLIKRRYLGISIFELILFVMLIIGFFIYQVIYFNLFTEQHFKFFGVFVLALFIYLIAKSEDKLNFMTIATLLFCSLTFFAVANQFTSVVLLFAHRNVLKEILGYQIPSIVFQSLNPLCVIIFGIIFAIHKNRKNTNDFNKFLLAMCATTFSLLVLYIGCLHANANFQVPYFYLALSILAIAGGEIIVVPFVQSRITLLSPRKLRGFIVALQMFLMAFSNITGIYASRFLAVPLKNGLYDPELSLAIYSNAFIKVAIVNFGLLCILIPSLIFCKSIINVQHKK